MSADCITNTLEGRTVLIVGCTGNIGHNLMNHALAEYSPFARVRGLARKTSKLPAHLRADSERGQAKGLELFDCEAFDLQGYERACEGVDTGICAYQGIEELALDAQLLLLRAAARSGVKQYVGASWNYDLSKIALGDHEPYDPYVASINQTQNSKPTVPVTRNGP